MGLLEEAKHLLEDKLYFVLSTIFSYKSLLHKGLPLLGGMNE